MRPRFVLSAACLAVMVSSLAWSKSPQSAVVQGTVKERLVLDEAFLKSFPTVTIDVTFETGRARNQAAIQASSYGCCSKGPSLSTSPAKIRA